MKIRAKSVHRRRHDSIYGAYTITKVDKFEVWQRQVNAIATGNIKVSQMCKGGSR